MSITFTSKNLKIPGALKGFTEKNLKRIEKISGDIMEAEIVVIQEKIDIRVDMTVKTKIFTYHVESSDPILKQALRSALSTFKSQAKKNKEKIKEEKKRMSRGENFIDQEAFSAPEDIEKGSDDITLSDNFSRKPLSVEEAVFFLKESKDNAYMFVNTETGNVSVVYVNSSRGISIIEQKQ